MHGRAMDGALGNATVKFRETYGREPNWDILAFRGCFTTLEALVEIWEES